MGNGSSQSIVLGAPQGHPYQRGVPRHVHPQNMVLPKPVAGQRLRCTDNGSILQTAGTIRGQRRGSTGAKEEMLDPEVIGVLKRRSEMIEKENNCYHHMNLRNHRMFHSDPDIARGARPNTYANQEIADGYGQRRSYGGGAAGRTSKLKYKKKARAPDPPHSLDRSPPLSGGGYQKNHKGSSPSCKCVSKTKAPQPPVTSISSPPPPPPLPVTTRTNVELLHKKATSQLSPSVTRAVECNESRGGSGYEKNVHPLDRWRICRSMGDVRIDEENDTLPSEQRTTVFDSRNIPGGQDKKLSYLPQRNDPFQKEIQAVTKKIAEGKEIISPTDRARSQSTEVKKDQVESQPKQYYFSDASAFKVNGKQKSDSSKIKNVPTQKESRTDKSDVRTSTDEIVPSLQRFSPARSKLKSPSRSSTPTPTQKIEKEWEHLSNALHNRHDDESDIDIRLRPVLPRKTPEMPKFSPSEAWQALGSDGLGSSNQSTSDESIPRYGRSPLRTEVRTRRLIPDTTNCFKQRSLSDSHWTPRQDLLDDSDVTSDDSEDAVIPRMRSNTSEFPTRFALPTVMFSNMRPIGYELSSNSKYFDENYKNAKPASKKKMLKNVDPEINSVSNFKKFLGKKNRYMSEEETAVSDSNWTFGQQVGLQKRGKQYSSDLMLSDRKKSDVMMKNRFGDFLGDILVTNASNMRHQMKSSDSGNSNFSFYSTEGPVMYNMQEDEKEHNFPPVKGRVYDIRRKFDANMESQRVPQSSKVSKRKILEMDLERKRDLELVRMLEDEVRKRRNKEKITIRQQLQKMKSLNSEDEEEFDDEAYFTEPKSREESNSPFYASGPSHYKNGYHSGSPMEMGLKYSHPHTELVSQRRFINASNSSYLSHWQSSPALLEDCLLQKGIRPTYKERLSSPVVMSSPDPDTWQRPHKSVNSWLLKQQKHIAGNSLQNLQEEPALIPIERSSSEESRPPINGRKYVQGVGGNTEITGPVLHRKEKRKNNIYKQLMDIVRREERNLKESQGDTANADSRDSSYSQRESSHSTTNSDSSSTSSYSYSDSSSNKNGVSANREFHASTSMSSPFQPERRDAKELEDGRVASATQQQPSFQVNFVQPYSPGKSYRPVPFDIAVPAAASG